MNADDGQLVRDYGEHCEEAVFAALLSRHGPMVMGVCRRVLGDAHAAEDAFQATFFTLARNASSIRRPSALASWLHGVAWRVAGRLRQARTPDPRSADQVTDPAPGPASQASWREIAQVLDEELQRLPEKHRLPLLLCHMEGMSQAEAARALGWPVRSLSSRLERGGELLRQRLTRRGVALSTAALLAMLEEHARAALLPALTMVTTRTARLLSLGQAETARQLSASALSLAEGMWHAMWLSKLKLTAALVLALVLVVGVLGLGIGSAWSEPATQADPETPPAAKAKPPQSPPPADPLAALLEALRDPVPANNNESELAKAMSQRKQVLQQRAGELREIGDMRAALAFQEWRDQDREFGVRQVDGAVRKELVERFHGQLRQALRDGETADRLAALALIADIGISVHGATPETRLTQGLTAAVAKVTQVEDATLRQAAARTLGTIHGEAKEAVTVLGPLLAAKDVADRQAAADGLAGLILQTHQLIRFRHTVNIPIESILTQAQTAVAALGRGLSDSDPGTRRACLHAVAQAAELAGDLTMDPNFMSPITSRPPTAAEKEEMKRMAQLMHDNLARDAALVQAVVAQAPAVVRALEDESNRPEVHAALEAMAKARAKQLRYVRSIPVGADLKLDEKLADPWQRTLEAAIPGLVRQLTHTDVRVRLASLYILETLEEQALGAAGGLIKALDDADEFVRWGAARALGRIGPAAAVAASELARKLEDPSGDVRLTAAAALERFGPRAAPAVFALARTLKGNEIELKLWALRALAGVGPDAAPAVPALAAALSDAEPRVRTAAARTLGKLGPAAVAGRPALLIALRDPDADVRTAASDALLAIAAKGDPP